MKQMEHLIVHLSYLMTNNGVLTMFQSQWLQLTVLTTRMVYDHCESETIKP